jgi:hypothetical protein
LIFTPFSILGNYMCQWFKVIIKNKHQVYYMIPIIIQYQSNQ